MRSHYWEAKHCREAHKLLPEGQGPEGALLQLHLSLLEF